MNNDTDNLKKRLIYRSQYRGTKEMDKLVGSFVETHIDRFNIDDLKELEIFLDIDDDTLYKFYNNQIKTLQNIDKEFILLYKSYIYLK